jgi:hypothetical protein
VPEPGDGDRPRWRGPSVGCVSECVGEGGFEPPTSCSQSRCAARLRYSPELSGLDLGVYRSARGFSLGTPLGAHMVRAVGRRDHGQRRRPGACRWFLQQAPTSREQVRLHDRHLRRIGRPSTGLSSRGGNHLGADIRRENIEGLLESLFQAGRSVATVSVRIRALQQFLRWLNDDKRIEADPMAKMKPPLVPGQPVPMLSEDRLRCTTDGGWLRGGHDVWPCPTTWTSAVSGDPCAPVDTVGSSTGCLSASDASARLRPVSARPGSGQSST